MKTTKILIITVLLSVITSCAKVDSCKEFNQGNLLFANNTTTVINIYLDGNYKGSIQPMQHTVMDNINTGIHQFRAVAINSTGGTIGSTAGSINITQCSTKQVNVN